MKKPGNSSASHERQEHFETTVQAMEDQTERLVSMHRQLSHQQTFKVGDLVEWKPQLKNRRLPRVGQQAIVTEVLSETVFDTTDNGRSTGIPLFREPLSLKLGLIEEGTFLEYHYDGRRFRHVQVPAE
jgi:hypothetical protein